MCEAGIWPSTPVSQTHVIKLAFGPGPAVLSSSGPTTASIESSARRPAFAVSYSLLSLAQPRDYITAFGGMTSSNEAENFAAPLSNSWQKDSWPLPEVATVLLPKRENSVI